MTRLAIWALIALFVINLYTGLIKGWGENVWFNIAFHFLGGFFVAMLIYSFYHNEFSKLSQPLLRFLIVAAMTIAVGAVWEFAEYVGNKTLAQPIYDAFQYHIYFMGDLDDTIQDLSMDAIGAFAFLALLGLTRLSRKAQEY